MDQSSVVPGGEKIILIKKLGARLGRALGSGGLVQVRGAAGGVLPGWGERFRTRADGAAFDLADEFGSETEEGGDHILGNALDEGGEGFVEVVVKFFAGEGVEEEESLLGGGKGTLGDEPEIAIQTGDTVTYAGCNVMVEDCNFGSLDGLDIKSGGLLPVKALIVGDPPVLDGKLDDLFDAVVLDEVHPETAF